MLLSIAGLDASVPLKSSGLTRGQIGRLNTGRKFQPLSFSTRRIMGNGAATSPRISSLVQVASGVLLLGEDARRGA
jgi:hypothetical protein